MCIEIPPLDLAVRQFQTLANATTPLNRMVEALVMFEIAQEERGVLSIMRNRMRHECGRETSLPQQPMTRLSVFRNRGMPCTADLRKAVAGALRQLSAQKEHDPWLTLDQYPLAL
jgi:hypothetical protein